MRIHLDAVDGLGAFLELEAVVGDPPTEAEARRALESLRKALEPALGPACAGSYADLAGLDTGREGWQQRRRNRRSP